MNELNILAMGMGFRYLSVLVYSIGLAAAIFQFYTIFLISMLISVIFLIAGTSFHFLFIYRTLWGKK